MERVVLPALFLLHDHVVLFRPPHDNSLWPVVRVEVSAMTPPVLSTPLFWSRGLRTCGLAVVLTLTARVE